MKDKEFKKQRSRIRALRKKWHNRLRLYEWDMDYRFSRGTIDVDGTPMNDAVACCNVTPAYRRAVIKWNMELVAEQDDEELERMFVHECLHILVSPMRHGTKCRAGEEQVCTALAWILTGYGT